MKTAVVFGGYGVFGSQVARALVKRSVPVIVAGRDQEKAETFAKEIGARGVRADVKAPPSDLVTSEHVVVDCAGPFSVLGTELLEACAKSGAHHVDIADDRGYAARVRALGPRFDRSAAVYGCSSLPAISLALARVAWPDPAPGGDGRPDRIRVTLFIGNDNPKGEAAIRSLVAQLGKPFEAPQGELTGFGDGETVELPIFGRRTVYDFDCSDYDLLRAKSISVKVGFEMRIATGAFALLARFSSNWGERFARLLAKVGSPRYGSSGGVVQVELFQGDRALVASLSGNTEGQRMAALPAAIVAAELAAGRDAKGALTAPDLIGARELLEGVAREGYVLALPA